MSEQLGNTAEILSIHELTEQKDAFIADAKVVDMLFKGGEHGAVRVVGGMSMTWSLPLGHHLEVSRKDGTAYHAMTMYEREHDYIGDFCDDKFDQQDPLIAHQITAYPHYGDTPCRFELSSRQIGPSYQTVPVWGDRIDEFNIVVMPDADTQA